MPIHFRSKAGGIAIVRKQELVIERDVDRVEHDVGIEAVAEFAAGDPRGARFRGKSSGEPARLIPGYSRVTSRSERSQSRSAFDGSSE
jgi:hypothetical protein